jgi:ketosteroid isomerase-like protein
MSGSPLGGATFMSLMSATETSERPASVFESASWTRELECEDRARIDTERDTEHISSPESREWVARHLFDAFNDRDIDRVLGLIHPEMELRTISGSVLFDGEPYRGHAGIRQYLADIETHWEELVVRPLQVRAAGEAVVALGEVDGRGRAGGFEGLSTTWVIKFRDGLVIDAQVFSDARHARRALGV